MDAVPEAQLPADMHDKLSRSSRRASQFLKALANENRLMLLCVLSEGEYSVTEMEEILGMRQPAISQQLARLREDQLVVTRRDGKLIYYSLASEEARDVMQVIYRHFCSTA